ncbi:flavodoxin family protein [Ruminococcus sp.]|uniref:flavodoxin family protein n=1 Tax=Ruminococcus sp. TaxID=41978 RepID=UPI0025D1A9D0|nr:flavodoxin family protein [Ruminococcus sp.]MBR1430466.1 flavodoxin [Ruminococcus sp.]
MKIEIRYFTKTGNTKKLAEAIAQELNIEAQELSAPLSEKTDILFLCNSVYWAGADSSVKKFIAENKSKIGLLVNVSTAAMIESTYAQIKKIAEKEGVKLSDKEFHCRGKFTALHSGHPDEADIAHVKAFARKVIGDQG